MIDKDVFIKFNTLLEPYYKAMETASGITNAQARLCVAYAIVTHLDFDEIPILLFRGALATGKSEALKQLGKICKGHEVITAKTEAALRDALSDCRTAIIDEGDDIPEALIRDRYAKATGKVMHKRLVRHHWQDAIAKTFGATVLARRLPIADTALRSRCIIIETKARDGDYHQSEVDYGEFQKIAAMIEPDKRETADRVHDTWKPILQVAFGIKDVILAEYAIKEMRKELRNLTDGQNYDPTTSCLDALKGLSEGKEGKLILLNELRNAVGEHFSLKLKVNQIAVIYRDEGFEISKLHGFPAVRAKGEKKG